MQALCDLQTLLNGFSEVRVGMHAVAFRGLQPLHTQGFERGVIRVQLNDTVEFTTCVFFINQNSQ
jgi:hypothetical protein